MAASKRLYVEVADNMKDKLDLYPEHAKGIAIAVQAIADEFKRDNRRFRYDKFFEACGLNPFGDLKG